MIGGRPATTAIVRGRSAISVNDPGHPLPPGWKRVPLREVADLGTGHTPSRKHPEYWDGNIPWIGIRDASAHHGGVISDTLQHVNELGLENSAARLLPKGTVCLSRTASVGYVVMMGSPMATSQDFVTWTCTEALDPRYLMGALLAEGSEIRRFGEGSTHTTIYFPEVKAFHIDLPPRAEQNRIATKLDALLARTKAARQELTRISPLIEHYQQAILEKAFSGELTADWRTEARVSPPKSVGLEQLISIPVRNGLSVRGSDQPPGVRALRLSALRTPVVDMNDVRYLPIDEERASRFLLSEGDVLVSRGNGTKAFVGLASLVPHHSESTIFPDTAFRIRLNPDCAVSEWFSVVWNAPQVREQIERAAKTTAGIWKISQGDLSQIKLNIPEVREQLEMVRRVNAAMEWLNVVASEQGQAAHLLDHLDQGLLAKAFHGELVPQDPNDEPVEKLLERIRAARQAKAPKGRGRWRKWRILGLLR